MSTEDGSTYVLGHADAEIQRLLLQLSAPVGGADDIEVLAYAVEVWRLMFPLANQLGLVPEELADLDTLLQRIQQEVAAGDAIVMMPPMITAWAHVN